jgi:hypothetical protein
MKLDLGLQMQTFLDAFLILQQNQSTSDQLVFSTELLFLLCQSIFVFQGNGLLLSGHRRTF